MKITRNTLSEVAPTLTDVKKLPMEQKCRLFLARLAEIGQNPNALNKHNLMMPADPYGLAYGYPDTEKVPVRQHLMGAPWTRLVNEGYLVDHTGEGFYKVTAEGKEYLDEGTWHHEVDQRPEPTRPEVLVSREPEPKQLGTSVDKSASAPLLNNTETELVLKVVQEFLAHGRRAARKLLVREYGSTTLNRLINGSALRGTADQKGLLPMVLAFEYCGDSDVRAFAKQCVETVTTTLVSLYKTATDDDPIKLSPGDIEIAVNNMFEWADSRKVVGVGLYLLQEFHILGGWAPKVGDPDQLTYELVFVNESILNRKNIDTMWDEFVQQTGATLKASSEPVASQDEPRVAAARKENLLLLALRAFCKDEEFEESLIRPHSKRPPKMSPSAAFELYVDWLLGLFGFSTIMLGEYEHILGRETQVRRASVDILAAGHSQNLLLLIVACTLGTPKQEDFDNLRHAREILLREAFGETFVQILPVVFTTIMGGAKCDYLEGRVSIPIMDADRLKELLALMKSGGMDTDFLIFLNSLSDPAFGDSFDEI